ncbi:MAG: peptidoglycan DD-metalloendopeptidase family protein [Pseudomonadota bacterium]
MFHPIALALVAACALAAPASAQKPADAELRDIEQRLRDKAAEEARLKDEAAEREKELAELRYRMIEAANALQDAEQRISEIDEDIGGLLAEQATVTRDLQAEQENLGDVLAALQSLERSKPPALLVSPDDANKAARIAMLLSDAAPALGAKADALRDALESLDRIKSELDAERAARARANEEILSRRDVLADLADQKRAERDVAARLAAAAQSETAALAARATSLRGILERLERFARSITPRLKPEPPSRRDPATPAPSRKPRIARPYQPEAKFKEARGALRAPVAGRLTGQYGAQRPEGGKFDGVRFITADNAIVTAPFQADVAFARAWDPIGNLIVLDVGDGYHILLMGVGAFLVEEGQEVSAGEPLGAMAGADARLDFEIRKNGEPVNPSLWLSRETVDDAAY